jgi:hypothetical protein
MGRLLGLGSGGEHRVVALTGRDARPARLGRRPGPAPPRRRAPGPGGVGVPRLPAGPDGDDAHPLGGSGVGPRLRRVPLDRTGARCRRHRHHARHHCAAVLPCPRSWRTPCWPPGGTAGLVVAGSPRRGRHHPRRGHHRDTGSPGHRPPRRRRHRHRGPLLRLLRRSARRSGARAGRPRPLRVAEPPGICVVAGGGRWRRGSAGRCRPPGSRWRAAGCRRASDGRSGRSSGPERRCEGCGGSSDRRASGRARGARRAGPTAAGRGRDSIRSDPMC